MRCRLAHSLCVAHTAASDPPIDLCQCFNGISLLLIGGSPRYGPGPLPLATITPDAIPQRSFDLNGALVWHAIGATRAAAVAAARWSGRGDPVAADDAATTAMRAVLGSAPGSGTVVTGEGAKDGAPMLADGERTGGPGGGGFDIP